MAGKVQHGVQLRKNRKRSKTEKPKNERSRGMCIGYEINGMDVIEEDQKVVESRKMQILQAYKEKLEKNKEEETNG